MKILLFLFLALSVTPIFCQNIAQGKAATQSTTYNSGYSYEALNAVDGNRSGLYSDNSITHTNSETNPWWKLDLQNEYTIDKIDIYNRTNCCSTRIVGAKIYIGNTDSSDPQDYTYVGILATGDFQQFNNIGVSGRYILVYHEGSNKILSLAELEAFGNLTSNGGGSSSGGSGAWNSNGNDINFSTGRVGIGLNTPTATLEVRQTASGNIDQGLRISRANNSEIIYMNIADNAQGQYGFLQLGSDTKIRANGQPSIFGGNVGIDTTDPLEKLHLQAGKFLIKSNQNTNNSTHNSGLRFTTDVNSRAAEILIRRGSTSQKTGMQFNTYNGGSIETMTLLNGRVGIGTNNPQNTLSVSGADSTEPTLLIRNTSYSSTDNTGTAAIKFGFSNHVGPTVEATKFSTNITGLNFYGEYGFNNEQLAMTIKPTSTGGRVGIGTSNPDAPLTVKGRIHAEEVKVDLSVPGPDYVFKADYKLRTLEEIRKYIAAHGHLPNIPAAKEMEDKGIDLGTMNMKLLEKIEELTLYILEQENRIRELETEKEKPTADKEDYQRLIARIIKLEQSINTDQE